MQIRALAKTFPRYAPDFTLTKAFLSEAVYCYESLGKEPYSFSEMQSIHSTALSDRAVDERKMYHALKHLFIQNKKENS